MLRLAGRFAIRTCIFFMSLVLAASAARAVPDVPKQTPLATPSAAGISLSTIAGDGFAGDRDGEALSARFFEPVAVAFSPDGNSVYVADASGQKIRRIIGGQVETFAGGGELAPNGQSRVGTFADGPVSSARFYRPTGLAVASDGAVYVADSGNARIRVIRDGMVSTLAGNGATGSDDGAGASARFKRPLAISIDGDGNFLVADFGNGIRRVTKDGNVTTLPLPSNTSVLGVSVVGSAKHQAIAYTDTETFRLWDNGDQTVVHRNAPAEELPDSTGSPSGVALLDERSALLTDLQMSAVRYYRRGQLGQAPFFMRSVIGHSDDATAGAGFRDGDPSIAQVSAPFGLAWNPQTKTAAIADTGNRRVRLLRGFSPRRPATTDIATLQGSSALYRIAIVGNSFLHTGVFWNESIAGTIEQRLNADRAKIGLGKTALVYAIRSDGITGAAEAQYAGEVLSSGVVDAVVVEVNFYNVYATYPQLKPDSPWRPEFTAAFRSMNEKFKSAKIPVMVVTHPDGYGTALLERYAYRQEHDAFGSTYTDERDLANAIDASGVRHLRLLEPFLAYETGDRAFPLFLPSDHHLSVAGSTFVGDAIATYIEEWKPWARR